MPIIYINMHIYNYHENELVAPAMKSHFVPALICIAASAPVIFVLIACLPIF